MNTPAVTNLLGARVRDNVGGEGTVMAIGTAIDTLPMTTPVRRDANGSVIIEQRTIFIALLLLDDQTMKTCAIEGWTLVAG